MDSSSSTGYAHSAQVPPSAPSRSCPLWLLNFGSSLHMTPDGTHLYYSYPLLLTTHVRTANGTLLPISSTGIFPPVHSLFLLSLMFPGYQ